MATRVITSDQTDAARSWGYQWNRFPSFAPESVQEFADILGLDDPASVLGGRIVLDAGCGNGRYLAAAAGAGAARVVGLDFSNAVHAAASLVRDVENASIVRGDLYRLPFSPGAFDVVFSIGVLHHVGDPAGAVRSLTSALRPGGYFFGWFYAREGNGAAIRIIEPLRRVLCRLPFRMTEGVSRVLAAGVWSIVHLLYAPLTRFGWGRRLLARLPLSGYLLYLRRLGFHATFVTIFDKLHPLIVVYPRAHDVRAWLEGAGLEDVTLSFRNGNSWRAWGRVPK
jgi:SAM-dependent methyltransferase